MNWGWWAYLLKVLLLCLETIKVLWLALPSQRIISRNVIVHWHIIVLGKPLLQRLYSFITSGQRIILLMYWLSFYPVLNGGLCWNHYYIGPHKMVDSVRGVSTVIVVWSLKSGYWEHSLGFRYLFRIFYLQICRWMNYFVRRIWSLFGWCHCSHMFLSHGWCILMDDDVRMNDITTDIIGESASVLTSVCVEPSSIGTLVLCRIMFSWYIERKSLNQSEWRSLVFR